MSNLKHILIFGYRLIFAVLSFFIFISCCKSTDESFFSDLENKRYNLLDIKNSKFTIDGKQIYTAKSVDIGNHFFSKNNYFLIDSLKVYSIFNNLGQTEMDLNKILNKKNIIVLDYLKAKTGMLVLDFGLKVKDSINRKPGELILLKKTFDLQLKDTVFIFSRKFMRDTNITNVIATRKYGIIGLYDYYYKNKSEKEIYKYYGWTYLWLLDDTYKMSHLKQLQPYSYSFPLLDLSKMKFLENEN